MAKKITKKLVKSTNARTGKNIKTITVKNADGEPDTTAKILVQNKISYTPKVSVIIPVYNVEKYLRECLDSVVNQTLREIEIICVDDGSTDTSLDILKEYASKDNRITVIAQQNLHAGVARNAGLAVARGEYIGFLDADDFADTDMHQKMYENAIKNNSDIVICKCANVDFETKEISAAKLDYSLRLDLIPQKNVFNVAEIPQNSFDFSQGFVWDKIFKRDFLEKNIRRFQNIVNTNDCYFTFSSLISAKRISYIKDVLVYKRHRQPKSLTSNRDKAPDCFITTIDLLLDFMIKHKIYSLYAKSFWNWALYLCFIQLKTLSLKPKTILLKNLVEKFKKWEKLVNDDQDLKRFFTEKVQKCFDIYAELMCDVYKKAENSKEQKSVLYNVINLLPKDMFLKYFSENKLTVNVAYAFDDNFALIGLTAIQSVIDCAEYGEKINFILMYDVLDKKYKTFAENIVKNTDHKITWLHIDSRKFKDYPISSWVTYAAWFRCLLPDLLPNLDRILYLDSDTIVRHSLVPMFYSDLKDATVGVIEDVSSSTKAAERLALKDKFYFNSGVMLIDCEEWRKNNTFKKIDKFVHDNKDKIVSSDQDTLNSVLDGQKYRLSPIYDYMEVWWRENNCDYSGAYLDDYEYAKKDATIVHFTGAKPIDEKCKNSYVNDFVKHMKNIPEYKSLYPEHLLKTAHKENIPIILASDNNYAIFMYITMVSILINSDKNTSYDFYLLIPSAFSSENQKLIYGLKNKYNCEINFIDMKGAFSDLTMQISHITSPTYYRLLAADLLPKYYDKCIYLDVDICVCQDLKQFYNIDLKDNYVASVVAAGYYFAEAANCKRLNLPSMKTYVNAGVLLMNLKQIRKDNITKKFIELSKNNYSSQDQDVINIACYGKILTLPPKYNAMNIRLQQNDPRLLDLYKAEDIAEAKQKPVIIHYADKVKPWDDPSVFLAEHWWNVANKMGYTRDKKIDYRESLERWWNCFKPKPLNLDNPTGFNEKIQWSKLYDSTPIKTRLADKYLVRKWVADKIGEKYLIPLLGVYDSFEEIDFDKLPDRFVIKTNHASGTNIIVKDKHTLNLNKVKQDLDKWMADNYAFHAGCELHYRDIPPKIIIEQYMDDGSGDLRDYKFTCFNGKPEFIWIDSDRHTDHKRNLYDLNWNQLNAKVNTKYDTFPSPKKPKCLSEMIKLAKILSAGFNYVRVDFYIINERVYFGEMTFTSGSGTEEVWPKSFEKRLADKFILPEKAYNIDTGEYYKLPKKHEFYNIKPYLLFPYYLVSSVYLKRIKLPILKFKKHIKSVLYSHSHRGKTDMLNKKFNKVMQSVNSVKNDITNQILQIKNQQSNLEKQIADLRHTTGVKSNNLSQQIADFQSSTSQSNDALAQKIMALNTVTENKSNDLSQQIADFKSATDISSEVLAQHITDLNSTTNTCSNSITKTINQTYDNVKNHIESIQLNVASNHDKLDKNMSNIVSIIEHNAADSKNDIKSVKQDIEKTNRQIDATKQYFENNQVLYFSRFETTTRKERGMCDMVSAPNFEERFKKLMSGLPAESAETVVKIIRRLQMIKDTTNKLDLFTEEEKTQLKKVRNLGKEILKVSDNLYAYKNYMLPINHFEASVFVYNHGISQLNSVDTFKDKDILDIGGFIGDSVLMLAPLTTGKVHSFEATNENYNHMLKTIELNGIKNAVPVHTAVGDKPGEIELRFNGSASSQNEIMVKEPQYVEKCPVITIDDYVREHKLSVGLIKVDIEGAEQPFLRGAYETIRTQKPTLLISIYHNVDDFLDIKPMIESWNLGYKFKIFKPTLDSISGETLLICEQ